MRTLLRRSYLSFPERSEGQTVKIMP
jgi:hypothetical protein